MKRYMSGFAAWNRLMTDATMLAIESQQVIAMRMTKLAMGGAGVGREAELMVTEKVQAMADSGRIVMLAAMGGTPDMGAGKVTRHYRTKVRANRRRLSK